MNLIPEFSIEDKKQEDGYKESEEETQRDDEKQLQRNRRFKRNAKSGAAILLFLIYLRYRLKRGKSKTNWNIANILANIMLAGSNESEDTMKRNRNWLGKGPRQAVEAPISILMSAAKRGLVNQAAVNSTSILYELKSDDSSRLGTWKKSLLPRNNPTFATDIVNMLSENGCLDISTLPEPFLSRIAPIFLASSPFLYLVLLYHMMKRLQRGDSDIRPITSDDLFVTEKPTTFADVAGIDNKVELQEVVSYLSDPRPFVGLGACPPKGLLLHGPPGCGKTLLARAVAGEAHADFFISCSGSDFVEVFVGQGSKRVRELFSSARREALNRWQRRNGTEDKFTFRHWINRAKRLTGYYVTDNNVNARSHLRPPTAVIFIDEIDALAKCRDGIGRGISFSGPGGNDEREQTLNALLTEMDGFGTSQSLCSKVLVIVIAATNRLSIIDPAILRPGRFDRHVEVPPPDRRGRAAILAIHAKKVKLGQDVNVEQFANDNWTRGFTGADLRNVMNEAALLAVRGGSSSVYEHHLISAVKKVKDMKL